MLFICIVHDWPEDGGVAPLNYYRWYRFAKKIFKMCIIELFAILLMITLNICTKSD